MSAAHQFPRRRLLAAGGGIAAALGLDAAFGVTGTAKAEGAVPSSGKFNLSSPSDRLFWKKPLHNKTVLQCFTFDNSRGHVYTMQRTDGTASTAGDLTVTQLDRTGKKLGRMYLKGFGHGIAFGVQPTSSGVTMWTEADAQSSNGSSARARVVCRFRFANTATPITKDDVELFEPVPGMYSASCTLDLEHNTIAVRHTKKGYGQMRVTLYDLTKFAAHDFTAPLADIGTNSVHAGVTPQGYQHYGQHLYLLDGNSYGHPDGNDTCGVEHPGGELDGNCHVSRINFNDETDHERKLTRAGYSLSFREPEGVGLVVVGGQPRLAMGFASGCPGDRRASIYYKHDPAS
jgi:hypothetical protein